MSQSSILGTTLEAGNVAPVTPLFPYPRGSVLDWAAVELAKIADGREPMPAGIVWRALDAATRNPSAALEPDITRNTGYRATPEELATALGVDVVVDELPLGANAIVGRFASRACIAVRRFDDPHMAALFTYWGLAMHLAQIEAEAASERCRNVRCAGIVSDGLPGYCDMCLAEVHGGPESTTRHIGAR